MRTLNISCLRRRRGVSTILGTLIFIGILFTSVIPMYLLMNQADTLYEQKMLEMKRQDDERDREDVEVYAFPADADSPDYLNVSVLNRCEFAVRIVRLWINDTYHAVDSKVQPMGELDLDQYLVAAQDGDSFDVKVTTDRGNVYASETGTLYYKNGEWLSETLGINLIFPSRPGKKHRENHWLNELKITIMQDQDIIYMNATMNWAISASEKFFEVDSPAEYRVIVYILVDGDPDPDYWDKVYNGTVTIDWPYGPAIVDVNFEIDGDHLIVP